MCTSLFLFEPHSALLFLLAYNRDEFLDRPTAPAHFWEEWPDLLAGRDIKRGGTWLGITKAGRFALVTNFREPSGGENNDATSRGALTTDFLGGHSAPLEYLSAIDPQAFNGFNLVVGDLLAKKVAYLSNRGDCQPVDLSPGLYGISNGLLCSGWPKVEKGKAALKALLEEDPYVDRDSFPWAELFEGVLGQTERADASLLPDTGMPPEVEDFCSPIFIQPLDWEGSRYGTKSQTAIAVWADGTVDYRERSWTPSEEWVEIQHTYSLEPPQ